MHHALLHESVLTDNVEDDFMQEHSVQCCDCFYFSTAKLCWTTLQCSVIH